MVLYYLLLSLAVCFSIRLFLFFFQKPRSNTAASNLPPGWLGLPVIGESLSFMWAVRLGRPEKFFFDRAVGDGAAFKTSLMGEPAVVLCGVTGNNFIYSNENKLVTTWIPPSMSKLIYASTQMNNSASLKKLRKLLPGLLKMDALRRNVGIMDEVARQQFAAERGGRSRDSVSMARLAKRYTFQVALRLLASLDDPKEIERLEELFNTVSAGMYSIPVNLPGTARNRALKTVMVLKNEVVKVIERRKIEIVEGKTGMGQDILSHMLDIRTDDGQFCSELDIASFMIGLVHASHGTTSKACTSLVKYLTELPIVYEAVYNEQMKIVESKAEGEMLNWADLEKMGYSWNVAQEVLRLDHPGMGLGAAREAITDFTYGGFSVPKGWKVFLSTATTHKNPAYFPDPDRFDPARFEGSGPAPYTYIPFGGGPRMCPGKEYARVKMLVFMHNFVKYCPREKLEVFPTS